MIILTQMSPISESKYQRVEQDQDLGQLSQDIKSIKKANDGLKDQNLKLMSINDRLIYDSELLRTEITKLRILLEGQQPRGNMQVESYVTEIRTLEERISVLQRSEAEKSSAIASLQDERGQNRRIIEEQELSIRKMIDQNKTMAADLDKLHKMRNSDTSNAGGLRQENIDLKTQIDNLRVTLTTFQNQANDRGNNLNDINNKYNALMRENQRLVDENSIMSKRQPSTTTEETMRIKITQLEQNNNSANSIINDLKARLARSQGDLVNKDKELGILREEMRSIQSQANSARDNSIRIPPEFQREKQELINLNQMLSGKLREQSDESARLKSTLTERDIQIQNLTIEVRDLKLDQTRVSKEGLAILGAEIKKYFNMSSDDRQISKSFADENLAHAGRVSMIVGNTKMPQDGQAKDVVSRLLTTISSFTAGEYSGRSGLHGAMNQQELAIEKTIEKLKRNSIQAKGSSSSSKRQINVRPQSIDVDNSEMIKGIIMEETGLSNTDKLQVVKNKDENTYECTFIDYVTEESSPTGSRRTAKIIRIPASVVDDLKEIHILKDAPRQDQATSGGQPHEVTADIAKDSVVKERFDQERRIIEQLKLTDEENLQNVLSQSKMSGGTQAISLSKLVADQIRPSNSFKGPVTAVTMEKRFSNDLGPDFKLITSIIAQSILRKSEFRVNANTSCLVKIEDFDKHSIKNNQEFFFFKQDYQKLKNIGRKELILNELIGALIAQSTSDLSKYDIYRQTESKNQITLEKIQVDPRDIISRGNQVQANVVESCSIDAETLMKNISEMWNHESEPTIAFEVVCHKAAKSSTLTSVYKAVFGVVSRLPRVDLTVLRESEKPSQILNSIKQLVLDHYLVKSVPLMAADNLPPGSIFIKQKEEQQGIVVDGVSNLKRNERQSTEVDCDTLRIIKRIVFDEEADVYSRPPLYTESFNGQSRVKESVSFDRNGQVLKAPLHSEDTISLYGKAGLGYTLDSEQQLKFEKSINRLPPAFSQAVSKSMARFTNFPSTINVELSELLYIIQSENDFCSMKNVFMRVYMKGDNKVYDRVYVPGTHLEEMAETNQPVAGYVTEKTLFIDYAKPGNTQWFVQKESACNRPDHKRTERMTIDKVKWRDISYVYNFKPNQPKNRGVFDINQPTLVFEDDQQTDMYALETVMINPVEVNIIKDFMRVKEQEAENYHLVLQNLQAAEKGEIELEKYNIPKLGINFALLVNKIESNQQNKTQIETNHTPYISTVAFVQKQIGNQANIHHLVTVSNLKQVEVEGSEGSHPHTQLSSKTEAEKMTKLKDLELIKNGHILIRETRDPQTLTSTTERIQLDDRVTLKPVLPEDIQNYKIEVLSRSFEKSSFNRHESALRTSTDFIQVCQGISNLINLMNQPTIDMPLYFLKESDDKLILEKVVCAKYHDSQCLQLVERLSVRLENSLLSTTTNAVQPSDLKIVKETVVKGRRHVCEIKLSEVSGIPIVNSKLKKSYQDLNVYEDSARPPLVVETFLNTPQTHLLAFIRSIFEANCPNEKYYFRILGKSQQDQKINFEKRLISAVSIAEKQSDNANEKLSVTCETNGTTTILRQIFDDSLYVEELQRVSPSQEGSSKINEPQRLSLLNPEDIKHRVVHKESSISDQTDNHDALNYGLKKQRIDDELAQAIQVMWGSNSRQVENALRAYQSSKVVVWEKKNVDENIYRRLLIFKQNPSQSTWQSEVLDTVIIKKNSVPHLSITPQEHKLANSNLSQSQLESQKAGIVTEVYDFQRGTKIVKKLKVDQTQRDTNGGPKIIILQEENVPIVSQKVRDEAKLFANFVIKSFIEANIEINNVIFVNQEVKRGDLHFEQYEIESEKTDQSDSEKYLNLKKDIIVSNLSNLLTIESNSTPTRTSGVIYTASGIDIKLRTIEITRVGSDFSIRNIDQAHIQDSSLQRSTIMTTFNLDIRSTLALQYLNQSEPMATGITLVESTPEATVLRRLVIPRSLQRLPVTANPMEILPKNDTPVVTVLTTVTNVQSLPDGSIVMIVNKQTASAGAAMISETLEVKKDGQRFSSKPLTKSESSIRGEFDLNTLDKTVLTRGLKATTSELSQKNQASEILVRKTRHQSKIVYDLILMPKGLFNLQANIIESIAVKIDAATSNKVITPSHTLPTSSNFFSSMMEVDKLPPAQKYSVSQDIRLKNDSLQMTGKGIHVKAGNRKQAMFDMTDNLGEQMLIPLAISSMVAADDNSDAGLRASNIGMMDVVIQRLIGLMTEVDTSSGLPQVLFIDNLKDNPKLIGRRLTLQNGEAGQTEVLAIGDRNQEVRNYQREVTVIKEIGRAHV